MRSFYMIMPFALIFAIIFSGCTLKEKQYGKFSEEEVSRMPFTTVESLPNPSGGVTLSIMGETITVDDVVNSGPVLESLSSFSESGFYELFAPKARPTVLKEIKDKVSKKYIYHTTKKSASSNIDEMLKKVVEKEKNNHLAAHNYNDALAREAFRTEPEFVNMGVTDWKSFEEYKKMMYLVRMYISRKIKKEKPVKLSDMKAMYDLNVEKKHPNFVWEYMLQLRVIDIHPDKLTPGEIDIANGQTKEQAALRKGKNILKLIEQGQDFGRLANENSNGVGNDRGGLWAPHIFGSRIEPYDVLDKAADKMKVGDVSDVIEADGHVFIMKLEDKREGGVIPFADAQERIEMAIKNLQQQIEYGKVLTEISDKIEVKDIDIFTDHCLKRAFELIQKNKTEN